MFVCSQLQHTYSAVFLLPITAASDLLVHKILLLLGYPMVKNVRRYLYSFWRNSQTWQTHRQTDKETDRHRMIAKTALMHRIARQKRPAQVMWISIHSWFLCIYFDPNILKGNLQPKFKGTSVWPKSTAVTGVIFTCPGRAGAVFRLDRGLTYFARIALRAAQHAMEPHIRSESRFTDGRTLDTLLKLTTSTV